MTKPKIAQKGPYVMEVEPGRYAWCTCGYSQKQPYCDTSHRDHAPEMRSLKVEITEKKTVAWCGCKQTGTPPFCDGTHNSL
jgi:CDGSH-type Zn-finger protein